VGNIFKKLILLFVFTITIFIFIPAALAAHVSCGDTVINDTDLDSDLLNCPSDGLIVGADNITLNCNGHIIDGSGLDSGISLNNRNGVTVKNCNIIEFFYGINLTSSTGNTLENNTANENGDVGIFLTSSTGNTLENNTANGNLGFFSAGIFLTQSSTGNTLENNTASRNFDDGIFLTLGSNNNNLTDNNVNRNGDDGIDLDLSDGITLERNTANENGDVGIELEDSNNNTLTDNTANRNLGFFSSGIELANSNGNTLNPYVFQNTHVLSSFMAEVRRGFL